MAALTIGSGVGKSGSPAPKPMTGRPAAFSALALASTASVADSAIPPMRAETRRRAGDSCAEASSVMAPMLALRAGLAHPGPVLGSTSSGPAPYTSPLVDRTLVRHARNPAGRLPPEQPGDGRVGRSERTIGGH